MLTWSVYRQGQAHWWKKPKWLHVNNLALIMDYTYRAMRSVTIIYTYWKVSEVLAPPADVRVGKVERGIAAPPMRDPAQAAAYILTNPLMNLFT